MKGKVSNGVGRQYSHATSERGISSITNADAHTSAASPHRFEWTRPFRGKTKSGFCACAITFCTSYTTRVHVATTCAVLTTITSQTFITIVCPNYSYLVVRHWSQNTFRITLFIFHCFTVHFVSLSFIYTNVCTCF